MTLDWILAVGTLVFAITTWATLNFGYGLFRTWGERDDPATVPLAAPAEGATNDPAPPPAPTGDQAGAVGAATDPYADERARRAPAGSTPLR